MLPELWNNIRQAGQDQALGAGQSDYDSRLGNDLCGGTKMFAGQVYDKFGTELRGQGPRSAWPDKIEHWLMSN